MEKLFCHTSYNCIVCKKEIKRLDEDDMADDWQEMWNGGIVDKMDCNYGSIYDGDVLIFGLCDDCITKLKKQKIIRYAYNYMDGR